VVENDKNLPTISLPSQTILAVGPSLDSEIVILKQPVSALIVETSKYPGYWTIRLFDEKNNQFEQHIFFLATTLS
jgi:hypothetical protein